MAIQAERQFPNIDAKQYQSAKRSLIRKEKSNHDRIYFIYCQGNKGWMEAGENSALIYYYEVIKRFGLKNRLFADELSLHNRYEIGYIRTQSLDDIRYWVKKAKLYQSEGKDSQRTLYFELKKTFSEKDLNHYLTLEKERRLAECSITPAHNLAPEFYQLLIGLGKRLHHICNSRLDRLSCDTIGNDIVVALDNVLASYHHLTYYKSDRSGRLLTKWQSIRTDLYFVFIRIKVLSDYGLLDREVCVSLSEVVHHLIDIAEKNIATIKPKKQVDLKQKGADGV